MVKKGNNFFFAYHIQYTHQNSKIKTNFKFSYLNAVQTTCPHILRYITAAAIISKRRKNIMKELVKIIQQESYNYRDPITELVECLYVNFDFDGAQVKLRKCDQVKTIVF
jgi:translation initiation factor 3 subunit E